MPYHGSFPVTRFLAPEPLELLSRKLRSLSQSVEEMAVGPSLGMDGWDFQVEHCASHWLPRCLGLDIQDSEL